MKRFYLRNNKGVALLWALVIIMVLLVISGSMAGLIIKELKFSANIDMSEQAYAAARSGVEVGSKENYCIGLPDGGKNPDPQLIKTISGDVSYEVQCIDEDTSANVKPTLVSIGHAGGIARKLKRSIDTSFDSAGVLAFPEDAGDIVESTAGVGDFAKLSYFKDTGAVVKDGNVSGANFYQQFDLTVPTVGTAAAGTVNITSPDNALAYFVVGIEKGAPGEDKIVYKGHNGTDPLFDGVIAEHQSFSTGHTIRLAISYLGNSNSFNVTAKNMDTGSCIGSKTIGFSQSYTFNNLVVYSSDGTLAGKDSAGIKIESTGSHLQNMILRGTSVAPTLTVVISGYTDGSSVTAPGINCGADCTEKYTPGSNVTLTAVPASYSNFVGWSGGGCSGTGNCTLVINGEVTVTATFSFNPFSLTSFSQGKTYVSTPAAAAAYADSPVGQLTNGIIKEQVYGGGEASVGWQNVNPTITIDLGENKTVSKYNGYFGGGGGGGINTPQSITVKVSTDNTNWTTVSTASGFSNTEQWIQLTSSPATARYVRFEIVRSGEWTMIGELQAFF